MTVVVTAETPRPLMDEPFVVTCRLGEQQELHLTDLRRSYTDEQIAQEWCLRVHGPGEYEVTVEGEHLHG